MESKKKKILFITVRSDIGGGPFHVDLLIKNLIDEYDIFIAAPKNEPYGHQWENMLGDSNFFELPFRSFNIITLLKLISFIKRNEIEIVHAHGRGAGIYSRLAKMFYSKFISVYTFHGFHIQQYKSMGQKFYVLVERFFSGFTDLFINVSRGEKNVCLLHRIFNESKSVVVYNALKAKDRPLLDKIQFRNNLKLPYDKFIVASVVSFNTPKNVPMIMAIAKQLSEYKDILFAVIGDGEQKQQIQELIRLEELKNVLLLGSKNDVTPYLFASDLYLSTSLWEGMPYSLIEAIVAELPIVASNVTGNNEVVQNEENGFLFELNQPEYAAEKIIEIFKSRKLQSQFGRNSLKIFNEKFELTDMIAKMRKVYDGLYLENKFKT